MNNDIIFHLHDGYDLRDVLHANEALKINLMRKYDYLLERIKDGESSHELNESFRNVVVELQECDHQHSKILRDYANLNNSTFEKEIASRNQINANMKALDNIKKHQGPYHVSDKDVEKIVGHIRDIAQQQMTLSLLEQSFFVPKETAMSDHEQKSPIKNIDVASLKKLAKENMFKFKNAKECISRARATFMSREDIIKAIDNNMEFKSKMPANYKKLSKEELCKKIDSLITNS